MNNTRNLSQELGYLRLLFDLVFDNQNNNPKNANIFNDNQFTGKYDKNSISSNKEDK